MNIMQMFVCTMLLLVNSQLQESLLFLVDFDL